MMGDRIPAPSPDPEPMRARIKVYNLRVTGPSTEGDEAMANRLTLDSVVTALLMLQVGDTAAVECVEETMDWGSVL